MNKHLVYIEKKVIELDSVEDPVPILVEVTSMVGSLPLDQIKVGMELAMEFGTSAAVGPWPQWPRYYFKPL